MKQGYLVTFVVTFTVVLSYFAAFISSVEGIEILDVIGDNAEPQIEFVDEESIIQTMDAELIPGIRKRRDAESKCFHFTESPRICAENGCKFNKAKKKCVNLDGSEDEEPTEKPGKQGFKFRSQSTAEDCKQYHGRSKACGYAGCRFNRITHRCEVGRSKSSPVDKTSGTCSKMDGNQKACSKTNGCKYVKKENKCIDDDGDDDEVTTTTTTAEPTTTGPPTPEECSKLDGKMKKCAKAGCLYSKETSKCTTIPVEASDEDEEEAFTTLP